MLKPIHEASREELRNFAIVHLGVDVDNRWGAEKIIAAIRAAGHEGPNIEVDDGNDLEADVSVTKTPQPIVTGDASAATIDPWKVSVTIRIHSSEEPGGKDDVQAGVNERDFLIQRDADVDVPLPIVAALNNAKREIYSEDMREMREVHQYAFSIVRASSEALALLARAAGRA